MIPTLAQAAAPAAAPDLATQLSALRGLHLPASAEEALQGEVVVAVAAGFVAALLVGLVRVLRARASVRRAALRELASAQALPPPERRVAQARLLRRLVRTLAGEAAAGTKGPAWAATLDRTFATDFFTRGAGAVLAEALYRPPGRNQADLDAELARLISRIRA